MRSYFNEEEERCQEESRLFSKRGLRQNAFALETAQLKISLRKPWEK
jgi:hypothetical protein